ncbi:type II toxin-antitoxin system BrnA family antitoxin [Sphingobium algorifonticola]|uniref:CopG family transcriptional regulator n=1 Tax=Sphingobium algorifonticola TaxID=2008318 RepID=A0A437J5Y6_9SPHN|nr:CopG family antitoxin [Sphingobium algorifonticola]RVT40193.1 CopG family transcriptional regulator [Sphingobium algorifonticola]
MKAQTFDDRFDAGESILDTLDLSSATRVNLAMKRVNVDFPAWMVTELDREAQRRGISRQALIKTWLADRLERAA